VAAAATDSAWFPGGAAARGPLRAPARPLDTSPRRARPQHSGPALAARATAARACRSSSRAVLRRSGLVLAARASQVPAARGSQRRMASAWVRPYGQPWRVSPRRRARSPAPGLVGSGTTLPVNGTVAVARARHPRRSGPWPRWHEREPPHGMARAAQQPRRTSAGTRPAAATWARPWRDRSARPAGAGSGHGERGRSSASRCTAPCGRTSLGQALAAWLRCIFSSPGIGPTSRSPVSPTTAGPRWCWRCPDARARCGHGARLQTGAMVASRLARESAQAERIGHASLVQRCLRRPRRRRCGPSVAAPASTERARNPT
jgi:hypothetical protein